MGKTISIIVPIFKVESYLSRCLESILNQTYDNLEIILVNDGSPDNCPRICDEYGKKDRRIKVVHHQENRGVAAARNSGLEFASGEFIAFVDPDDYIDKKMYEILYRNMEKYDADISMCDISYVYDNVPVKTKNYEKEEINVISGREALANLYNKDLAIITVSPTNKLYKRELFHSLRYEEGKVHEDEFIIHYLLDRVNLVVYSNCPLYYYYQRSDSIMGAYTLKRLSAVELQEKRMLFFEGKEYEELYDPVYQHYLDELIHHYHNVKKFFPNEIELADNLRKKFIKAYNNREKRHLDRIPHIKYKLFLLNPSLCIGIRKVKGLVIKV